MRHARTAQITKLTARALLARGRESRQDELACAAARPRGTGTSGGLGAFRDAHLGVIVSDFGFGIWHARIPEPDGERIIRAAARWPVRWYGFFNRSSGWTLTGSSRAPPPTEVPAMPRARPGSKIRITSSISRSVLFTGASARSKTTVICCQAFAMPRRI